MSQATDRRASEGRQMARQWRGVIEEYRDRLPVTERTPVITLGEGGTPLVESEPLSEATDCRVLLKYEGANPTGSFKDRGMTLAISKAVEDGSRAVVCASTGNTSASAAAYAAKAGLVCGVLVPAGKIASGKMAQTLVHGARVLEIRGNFDDALRVARELGIVGACHESGGRVGRRDPGGDGPGHPGRLPIGGPGRALRGAGLGRIGGGSPAALRDGAVGAKEHGRLRPHRARIEGTRVG